MHPCCEEAVKKRKGSRYVTAGIITAALLLIFIGVLTGEAGVVYRQGIRVCLSCIGLG